MFNVAPPTGYLGDDPTDPLANFITRGINNQQPPIPYPVLPPAPMPPQDPGQGIPNSPLLGGNLPPTPAPYLGGVNGPEDGVSLAAESRAAKDKMAAQEAAHPVLTDPKWWQRLAGGVAGGLAGWSNASGHRQPPIDIAAMEQNILHPGYADKLAQWQSQLAPLQAQAEIAGGNEAAWWKSQQIQAQIEMEKQHGAYWQQRAQMEQNQWKIDPKSGAIYNTITGERGASAAPTPQDRYNISKALGGSDDEARYYGENGNLSGFAKQLAPRNMNPSDVLLHPDDFPKPVVVKAQEMFNAEHRAPQSAPDTPPRGTPAQFAASNTLKAKQLSDAEDDYNTAVTNAGAYTSGPTWSKEINQEIDAKHATAYAALEKAKRAAQDTFLSNNITLGGTPGTAPSAVPPPSPPPKPAVTPTAPRSTGGSTMAPAPKTPTPQPAATNAPNTPGQLMQVQVPGGWLTGTPAQVKAYLAKKGLSLAKE